MPEPELSAVPANQARFATTHWSVVLEAKGGESPLAAEALEKLANIYWYPLYVYVRRKGHGPHDAQDLTQEFFARLLRGKLLQTVEQRKGKFRSYLLTSLEHFLVKDWLRANRLKRGGGQLLFSLDEAEAENRYAFEPADPASPEKIYERRWAMTLLEQAMKRLETECQQQSKSAFFEHLKNLLTCDAPEASYHELAAALGMSEGAVRTALHRLRQRFGALLRDEIAQTVARPEEIDEELRSLFTAFSAG